MLFYGIPPEVLIILVPVLLMSLTIHEFAHARMALAMGDPTAKMLGRCTLNPLKHLDIMGSIAILLVGFGWAKPVPINPRNFRHPSRDDILVSFAGPASNFIVGTIAVIGCKILLILSGEALTQIQETLFTAFLFAAIINYILGVFNMIPLYPLDGHHIMRELLAPGSRMDFMRWQLQYGRFVLMALIFAPMILPIVDPIGIVFGFIQKFIIFLIQA